MAKTVNKRGVKEMFDNIANHYDFLNHFLTLGIDIIWRKQTVKQVINKSNCHVIVDVATGTGDLAIELIKQCHPDKLIGLDLSPAMMAKAQAKIDYHQFNHIATLQTANGEDIPLPNNYCDLLTIGFGIRNFQNPEKGLAEFYRILKPEGQLVILEFSQVKPRFLKFLFNFYTRTLLPLVGKLISKHPSAYNYLPASIQEFPAGNAFASIITKTGFNQVTFKPLTWGIATIYWGIK